MGYAMHLQNALIENFVLRNFELHKYSKIKLSSQICKISKYMYLHFFIDSDDPKIAIQQPKEIPKRDEWGKQIEFLLASIGYCVGIGNVWR